MSFNNPERETGLFASVGVGEKGNLELSHELLGEFGVASPYWLQLDLGQTVDPYGAGGGIRKINDAVVRHRPTVVYAHKDGFVVSEIGDPDPAAKG